MVTVNKAEKQDVKKVDKVKKVKKEKKDKKSKKKVKRHHRNPILSAKIGLRRYSKSRVYNRRGIFKLKTQAYTQTKTQTNTSH